MSLFSTFYSLEHGERDEHSTCYTNLIYTHDFETSGVMWLSGLSRGVLRVPVDATHPLSGVNEIPSLIKNKRPPSFLKVWYLKCIASSRIPPTNYTTACHLK